MSTPSGSQGSSRRRRIAGERRRPDQVEETTPAPLPEAAPQPKEPEPSEPSQPPEPSEPSEPPRAPRPPRTGKEWPRFVAVAVLALVLVATALWLGLRTWSYVEVRTQENVEQAEESASATAERAAATILAFSHTTLDADLQAATRYLTPSFAETYTETFNTNVRPQSLETKATVTAKVLASAVVTASEDRAQILIFVDQTTVSTANGGRPQVGMNRTTFDMVKVDGSWLVDGVASY